MIQTFQADFLLPLVEHLLGDQVPQRGRLLDGRVLHQQGIHLLTQPKKVEIKLILINKNGIGALKHDPTYQQ